MDKKQRHEKAENFRRSIIGCMQRKSVINGLLAKQEYSEADKLYVTILFQKTSYIVGCENEYTRLIARVKKDESLSVDANKISSFEAKL